LPRSSVLLMLPPDSFDTASGKLVTSVHSGSVRNSVWDRVIR